MIEPNIYCKCSGAVMHCISLLNSERVKHEPNSTLPHWGPQSIGHLPSVIEIGCADGQGTMRYAGFCSYVICIDPMVNDRPDIHSVEYKEMVPDAEKFANFMRRNQEFPVKLVQGCSMWPETLQRVREILAGERVDILVVDGCHHPFEAVIGDFDLYYPFVKQGVFVIFDDLYEECILQAYELARDRHSMTEVDRFYSPAHVLQDTAVLRKTEP